MSIPVAGTVIFEIPDGREFIDPCPFHLGNLTQDGVTIPGNMSLVIEFVTAHVALPFGQKPLIYIYSKLGMYNTDHFLLGVPLQGIKGGDTYIVSQPVKLYADPGSTVLFYVEREPTAGICQVFATFSGYADTKSSLLKKTISPA